MKQRHYITIFEKPFRKSKTHEHKVPLIAPVFLDEMHLSDNSLEAVLEPLDGLALGDLVAGTDMRLSAATLGDTLTRTGPIFVSSFPCTNRLHSLAIVALTCSSRSPFRRYQYQGHT